MRERRERERERGNAWATSHKRPSRNARDYFLLYKRVHIYEFIIFIRGLHEILPDRYLPIYDDILYESFYCPRVHEYRVDGDVYLYINTWSQRRLYSLFSLITSISLGLCLFTLPPPPPPPPPPPLLPLPLEFVYFNEFLNY